MMCGRELVLSWFAKGYFVEAGAHDGVGDSETKQLADSGWTGICVEPSSAYKGLIASRNCKTDNRCLFNSSGSYVTFREILGGDIELSGIVDCFKDNWDREMRPYLDSKIETVTLTDLLIQYNAPPTIQFLVLDTEGSEYTILSKHDFASYHFNSILVEYNGVASYRAALLELLLKQHYLLHYETEKDLFLVDKRR